MCHQAQHPENGLPLMTTYTEWRDSDYNTGDPATIRTCQDCHDDGHGEVTDEQIQSAAQVQVVAPDTIRAGEEIDLQVEVCNVRAGHHLPTGSTELRQMWLEVTVGDGSGRELFCSGHVDQYGDPDREAVTYGTEWRDEQGSPTARMWDAVELTSDYRIPAQGSVTETYSLTVPEDAETPLHVQATLKYRRIAGYYAGILAIIADSDGIDAPVVEMSQDSASIEVMQR
jgi:hypothetical protein